MQHRNLYLAASIACMTGALFGYSVGFIGGILVLPSFLHHFDLDLLPAHDIATAQSKIVSSWLVGCVIGVPLSVPFCSKYGRRLCITLSASLYVVGALLQLSNFNNSIGIFQLGRIVNGVGVGAGTLVSPLYISEISPPSKRGSLLSGYQVAIQIFALIGFWGAFVCNSIFNTESDLQWQIPVSIQMVPSSILLVGSIFILRESPQWLLAQHREDDAFASLKWLREADDDTSEIGKEILRLQTHTSRTASTATGASFVQQLLSKPLRKRIIVGAGIMIWQNAVGLNALNYYSPLIFMSAGFTSVSSSLFLTGVFGIVKLISALLFMFMFVRVKGNRFWLLLGCTVMALAMFVLALCIKNLSLAPSAQDPLGAKTYGMIAVLMVMVFAFAFGVSLGPISWNVCAEIFPSHLSTKACAVTTCVQWISQIGIASITPPLIASIGWATYLLYGTFCVCALLFCLLIVPETRGVSLGPDMDRAFGDDEVHSVPEVGEIEESSETTPLIAHRRRRSSIALVV